MSTIFWTGKLSLPMTLMVNANNILAWLTGNTRNTAAQNKAITEMVRVLRPRGFLSVGAHGPEHYWEACDASFRAINKRYVLGYRLEFWPLKEEDVRHLLARAGLIDIRTRRLTWRNIFKSGGEAYDFFSAISSNFWYANFPQNKREEENRKTRDYFERKGVVEITDDVIFAYGRKP